MQNKKSTEQVIARRLRPIYDSIDAAQYKKAVIEADKVLKKHPQTYTAKALKALAFIRIDRLADASQLLTTLENDIESDEPDENTIQALCHCYKELNNPEKIVLLYSSLVKRYPSNEKLMRELFIAHVRTKNFRQQQQIAMQLYRETKALQYYCWALISVLMQGYDQNNNLGSTMFFPLAEKMLEKVSITEIHQIQGGFDLHLLVLESREKYTESIELILSKSSETDMDDLYSKEQQEQRLDHLYKMSNNNKMIMERALAGIEIDLNEWNNWVNLAESAIANIKEMESQGPDQRKKIIDNIVERWRKSMDIDGGRGPLLGQLHLINTFISSNILTNEELANYALGAPISVFQVLSDAICHKPFAFADMKPFLHLLDSDSSQKLLTHVASYRMKENRQNKQTNANWSYILWEQLSFHFSPPHSLSNEQLNMAIQRVAREFDQPPAIGNDGILNGLQITALAQLIIQYLWEFYKRKSEGKDILVLIISFIEWVYTLHDECTASIPISLCRLYGIFGDITKIQALEKQMQLKFIQRDSLAFLHFFVPYQFGHFKNANIYFTSLGAMYDMNEREVNECLVGAYKNNHFRQIPKLMEFARLSLNSIFSLGADVLNRSISACFAVNPEMLAATLVGDDNENDEFIDWQKIADNRDFSVFPPIIPDKDIANIRDFSIDEMRHYFKLKHSLISAIGYIGTEKFKKKAENFFDVLQQCREHFLESNEMESHFESFINLRLHSLVDPANKLFQLPCAIIKLGMDFSDGLRPDEPIDGILQKFPTVQTLSSSLEEIHTIYSKHDTAELDGRTNIILSLTTIIEILAFTLIGWNLLVKRIIGSRKLSTQENGSIPKQAKNDKKADKQASKCNDPLLEAVNFRVHLIAQTLERIQSFLSTSFKKTLKRERILDKCEGLLNVFPENQKNEVAKRIDIVITSLNAAHSIEEMENAITHLLLNYCFVSFQNLNIHK